MWLSIYDPKQKIKHVFSACFYCLGTTCQTLSLSLLCVLHIPTKDKLIYIKFHHDIIMAPLRCMFLCCFGYPKSMYRYTYVSYIGIQIKFMQEIFLILHPLFFFFFLMLPLIFTCACMIWNKFHVINITYTRQNQNDTFLYV